MAFNLTVHNGCSCSNLHAFVLVNRKEKMARGIGIGVALPSAFKENVYKVEPNYFCWPALGHMAKETGKCSLQTTQQATQQKLGITMLTEENRDPEASALPFWPIAWTVALAATWDSVVIALLRMDSLLPAKPALHHPAPACLGFSSLILPDPQVWRRGALWSHHLTVISMALGLPQATCFQSCRLSSPL